MSIDYKKTGVDIEKGEALVDWLVNESETTEASSPVVSGIGGFAALFRADFKDYKNPLLVSSTDGVGTKVLLASHFGQYEGIGQDLVAMCVNDLLCCGAKPLFFLDYYACGHLDLANAKEFLTGLKRACAEAQCFLIGGETAEMPGVYQGKDFDCAGFSVGVVDADKVLSAQRVSEGDVIVGIASSGFHSNGFSLLRKVFAPDLAKWKDELMRPTQLYVKLIHSLLSVYDIKAMAHITGGGIGNLTRVLPVGVNAELVPWKIPSIFIEVWKRAKCSTHDLLTTLNCGIGFALVLPAEQAQNCIDACEKKGVKAFHLGRIVANSKQPPQWTLDLDELERQNL